MTPDQAIKNLFDTPKPARTSGYFMGTCESCGCKRKEENMFCAEDGELYCKNCITEMLCRCEVCGKLEPFMAGTDDGFYYCEDCIDYRSKYQPQTKEEIFEIHMLAIVETHLEAIRQETAREISRQQPIREPLTDQEARDEMCRNYGINNYADALNRFSDPAPHRKRNIIYQQLEFRKISLQEKGRELGVVESIEYEAVGLTTDEYVEQFAGLLLRGASVPEATLLAALA